MNRLIFVSAAALLLSSCTTVGATLGGAAISALTPADAVGDTVVLEGTRGLILAHNAYQAAATSAAAAIRAGWLEGERLEKVDAANKRALALLNDADATLTDAERAAAIFNAVNDISQVIEGY
jgi:hypothetical protein